MGLGKQARILSKGQVEAVLSYLATTRHPERDRVIFLLSLKAGLRAKEIAALQWSMITDAEGKLSDAIHLPNSASKGRSGRVIPLNKELRTALDCWRPKAGDSRFVIITERSTQTSSYAIVNKFAGWIKRWGSRGRAVTRVDAQRSRVGLDESRAWAVAYVMYSF